MAKYKGNEIKYLKKILSGQDWSGTSGGVNNALEKLFSKNLNQNIQSGLIQVLALFMLH